LETIESRSSDLLANAAAGSGDEKISVVAKTAGAKIEGLVSTGQVSPAGIQCDQGSTELAFQFSVSAAIHSKSPHWHRQRPVSEYRYSS
jgi:hypothetical protein